MELAPARDCDPAILLPGPGDAPDMVATKEFVLLLGLAYNDIKALCWVDDQLRKGVPNWEGPPTADPYAGNWMGTLKTFDRLSSGVLTETYYLVRKYTALGVFKTPLFDRAFRKLDRRYRDFWKAFLQDAEHPRGERFRTFHESVRNTVGFHYSRAGKAMTEGYRAHVAMKPGDPKCDRAWASFGKHMEGSRFYFADAAAVQLQERIAHEAGKVTPDERKDNVRNLNFGIRMLLENLLEELDAIRRGKDGEPAAPATPR
jgi:hypothetical protein